jgi:hypothetical protein
MGGTPDFWVFRLACLYVVEAIVSKCEKHLLSGLT